MGKQVSKVFTEQERQQLVDELIADRGPDWAEQCKPGSFGCHELLDRTALVADTVERDVLTHPACVQTQDWFALADQALAALRQLYPRIGQERLDEK